MGERGVAGVGEGEGAGVGPVAAKEFWPRGDGCGGGWREEEFEEEAGSDGEKHAEAGAEDGGHDADAKGAAFAAADKLEGLYSRVGVPTRLRQIQIPREDLQAIANETVKNFNFNPGLRSAQEQIDEALRLLKAAY